MKSALIFVAACAASAVSGLANAGFYDGNKLQSYAASYEKTNSGVANSVDQVNSALYMGYVAGISDVLRLSGIICPPSNATVGQAVAITSKYLRENPEHWSVAGELLVSRALTPAFPCSGK